LIDQAMNPLRDSHTVRDLGRGARPAAVTLIWGWALCLGLYASGARSADDPIDLRIAAGRLSVKADDVTVGDVLQRVAKALNARLSISPDLAAHVGHWELREIPVAEAVIEIARPLSVTLVLSRARVGSADAEVREIYVLGGPAEGTRPQVQSTIAPSQGILEATRTLTTDSDPEIRRAAAAELGRISAEESVRALDRALGDADGRVRIEVVESLGRIGTDEALRLVAQAALGSSDPELVAVATRVLEGSSSDRARTMLPAVKARAQMASPDAQ
jgi:hypothetical protein